MTGNDLEPTNTQAWVPSRDDEAVAMYVSGIPVQDICADLAIAPPSLYLILRKRGVAIDRRRTQAHPHDHDYDEYPPRPVGRPPIDEFPDNVKKVLLEDFQIFGSARKVAFFNGLSYWAVRRFLRTQGIQLEVGAKPKIAMSLVDLVGKQIPHVRMTEIKLAYERLVVSDTSPIPTVGFEDFASEYGISVGVLATILTSEDAANVRTEKARATHGLLDSDTVAAIMNEVETRLRRKMDADMQLPLL